MLRLILIVLGVGLAILGLFITSRPITISGRNQCSINAGCGVTNPVEVPSVGLGMIVFIFGLLSLIYGYRRQEGPET